MEDRLEILLNKANNTLSDLPTNEDWENMPSEVRDEKKRELRERIAEMGWHKSDAYILHLTDVIDRLEWALDNTLKKLEIYEDLVKTLYVYGPDGITFTDPEEEEEAEDEMD